MLTLMEDAADIQSEQKIDILFPVQVCVVMSWRIGCRRVILGRKIKTITAVICLSEALEVKVITQGYRLQLT